MSEEPTKLPEEEKLTIVEAETTTTEPETTEPRRDWRQNFNVKEEKDVETIDRLTIKAGINEYKGNLLVFLAKVTDKNFSRTFFSMPAYVWEKAIPILQEITPRIAEVEKQTMKENLAKELARLKELGIDINEVVSMVK